MSAYINIQEKAKTIPELIDYYEICNRAEGKSPKTISWYSANLKNFHTYLRSRHLSDSVDSIDTKLLREYILYLMKRNRFEGHPYTPVQAGPLSPATIHGHVRTLKAFFNWVVNEGLTESNPTKVLALTLPDR